MNKYIIKFFKTGNMKYISHLDIMNVFQRAFRRAEIKLAYSQGFSPHPKLSIAHPLSLGIESIGEYMEVELVDHHNPQDLQLALNRQLPKGIGLLSVKEMTKKIKSIAAEIQFGEYELSFPKGELDYSQLEKAIHDFLELEEILVIKKQKKKRRKIEKEVNIKPLIHKFELQEETEEGYKINTLLKTGSNGNLNPQVLMNSFINEMELDIDKNLLHILRKELYTDSEKGIVTIDEI